MKMYLENEKCSIEIIVDKSYIIDSADNRYYDVILNPGKYKRSDFYKAFGIYIHLPTRELSLVLIGAYDSSSVECAILEDEILTVLQNDHIVQISTETGEVIQYIALDCFGCNFAIFKVDMGYIIHGEIEITMLDFELHKKWAFSGRDIFVSVSGKQAFEIKGDQIYLCDFEDNAYVLDFEGKLINKKAYEIET